MKKCPFCQAEILDDSYFCYYCGNNISPYQPDNGGSVSPGSDPVPAKKNNRRLITVLIITAILLAVALGVILVIVFMNKGNTASTDSGSKKSSSSVQSQTETSTAPSNNQTTHKTIGDEDKCLDNYMSYVDDRLVGTWVGNWVYKEGNEVVGEDDGCTYKMVFQNDRMFYIKGNNKISNTVSIDQSSPYLVKDNILTINSVITNISIEWISSDEIMMTAVSGGSFNYHMHKESSSTPYSLTDSDKSIIGKLQARSKEGWLLEASENDYPKYIYKFYDDRILFRGYEKDEYGKTIFTSYQFLYAVEDGNILYMHENGNQYYLGIGDGTITDVDNLKVTYSDGYTMLNMDDPSVYKRSLDF